jgi:protein translocase SecG subunit
MKLFLLSIHIIISLSLVGLILLQTGKGGLGRAFGGDVVYRSKRGAERIIFYATVVTAVLFFITSVANYFVR